MVAKQRRLVEKFAVLAGCRPGDDGGERNRNLTKMRKNTPLPSEDSGSILGPVVPTHNIVHCTYMKNEINKSLTNNVMYCVKIVIKNKCEPNGGQKS